MKIERKKKKKAICIVFIILLALIAIGIGVLCIREKSAVKVSKQDEWINSGNRVSGNDVIYRSTNGWHTFPLFWGEGLYLYSIEEKKSSLIAATKVPYFSFAGRTVTIAGQDVYYEIDFEGPIGGGIKKTLSHHKSVRFLCVVSLLRGDPILLQSTKIRFTI